MGAFNEWAAGSFLAQPENRRVVTVALNLLYGASVATRLSMLRCQGIQSPSKLYESPHSSWLTLRSGCVDDDRSDLAKGSEPQVPLAIIGIGCLFPKADGLEQYWANIRDGIDAITEIPPTHWRPEGLF